MNPQDVARTYIDTWNATDPARRTRLLQSGWNERARYVDPLMSGDGHEQIDRLVAGVHERFPGFRFALLGTPDGHGDHVRLAWSLGPEGAEPPIKGSDVIELREGRIARVIGFLDQVPATA
ncbi:MAG TPA: nuclear transport factor 2 family protein [Caldimonas sp.]|nr:nuclear transport factor 2 family protein [Caldimonas sp.]